MFGHGKRIPAVVSGLAFLCAGCLERSRMAQSASLGAHSHEAVFARSGVMPCFPAGTALSEGRPATCEISAVAATSDAIYFANDKPAPLPFSSLFAFPRGTDWPGDTAIPFAHSPFTEASKYEDMAVTPDGSHVLAVTGFDRWKSEDSSLDGFNTLLAWPAANPASAYVVNASERSGVVSSLPLRQLLQDAVGGVPYFKVEGLAALPDGRILFGVRETGESYQNFEYRILLLEGRYETREGRIAVGGPLRPVLDFKPRPELTGGHTVALSGLAFDARRGRLLMLTSFEDPALPGYEGLGAFLWQESLDELSSGHHPTLVQDAVTGKALEFSGKAEGMTILDSGSLLVVQDDDRTVGQPDLRPLPRREIHEFLFDVLEWR